jgi:aminoglycoside phosphotransferase (APT) family kinase protein
MSEPPRPRDEIAQGLLAYLRSELNAPQIAYATPLTRLEGGYETYTFRFALESAPAPWDAPLVLRIYPARLGARNALWESTVQNLLADAGYPVARAHTVCTDPKVLGGVFFVMDLLPGELLMAAPPEQVPTLLGKTHARLHDIDPRSIRQSLLARGYEERRFSLQGKWDWLQSRGEAYPWLREVIAWLDARRPPEPPRLSVCHGDFHPLNILFHEGKVSGVLDWPGFAIADPLYDIANTVILTSVSGKHILQLAEWELALQMYLAAYQAARPIDLAPLDYYRVRRCTIALAEGAEGHPVWRQAAIASDLVSTIREGTGILVEPPDLD